MTRRSPTTLLVALLLASATVMALDLRVDESPLDPARRAVGEVLGPAEQAASAATRPITAVPDWFRGRAALHRDVARLEAENAELRAAAATHDFDRNRLAELDGLISTAEQSGRALVPAHVVAYGPVQSFTRTVTIDAGSAAGVRPDLTVVNADGLVGRVLRVTRTTATVLLVLDADSVVGARVGSSMEIGFLRGRGVVGQDGRLDLELVDGAVVPATGDTVLTWGSRGGAPYVSGIPVGRVETVYASLRDSTRRAVVEPAVDFTALDVVGVVVASGTASDRGVIEADGKLR